MKKLIYVVDLKKNFSECQKKQHFPNLSYEIALRGLFSPSVSLLCSSLSGSLEGASAKISILNN